MNQTEESKSYELAMVRKKKKNWCNTMFSKMYKSNFNTYSIFENEIEEIERGYFIFLINQNYLEDNFS